MTDFPASPGRPALVPAPRRLFALVDGSAFYCSCERVFDPSLEGVPVAVLSNNDGCVVARSQEVKDAGVTMGAPFFQARERLEQIGARVFSSNYTLYGDMSRRVMGALESFTPDVEPYSIDEAFLSIPTPPGSPIEVCEQVEAFAARIRARVRRWTGIPVRVSFAETRTLAKAASELARARMQAGGEPCVCLYGDPVRATWLERLPVGDVWGVGRQWAKRLAALGVHSAAHLAALPDAVIRSRFNVVLLRTAYELRGVSCLPLDHAPVPRQTLIRSRSFAEPVTDPVPLSQAVATHAARAAEKLRREGLAAAQIGAFITTKGHGRDPHRSAGFVEPLPEATADTALLIAAARRCLQRAYEGADRLGRPFRYRKAGVTLAEIRPQGQEQRSLWAPLDSDEGAQARRAALLAAVDASNRRYGKRAVGFAAMGPLTVLRRAREEDGAPAWEMRRERMSPRYTTRWDELAVARASDGEP